MRRTLSLAAFAFAFSAHASERIDIAGAFGDENGCAVLKSNFDWDVTGQQGVYLNAERYAGFKWSCHFEWVGGGEEAGGQRTWSVIAQCFLDGLAASELLTIQQFRNEVIVKGPNGEGTALKPC